VVFDQPAGTVRLTEAAYLGRGDRVPLLPRAVPIVPATLDGRPVRMFFDSGAQVGYLDRAELRRRMATGVTEDFFPGFGTFKTATWQVPLQLGRETYTFTYGRLPRLLGGILGGLGTSGIVGFELLVGRTVVYAPRRGQLVVGKAVRS
jgi:hypothetical protein